MLCCSAYPIINHYDVVLLFFFGPRFDLSLWKFSLSTYLLYSFRSSISLWIINCQLVGNTKQEEEETWYNISCSVLFIVPFNRKVSKSANDFSISVRHKVLLASRVMQSVIHWQWFVFFSSHIVSVCVECARGGFCCQLIHLEIN